ncbi:unnamed protein product [Orchesella dallaii]|uniref:C2H2-type domain-containing protein n=1 Tax=Orchesella dallaii TaxID=48710 RepID=A0ABP1PWE5_9HEXA
MTLLGKIFRPWDLAANETFECKSNDNSDECLSPNHPVIKSEETKPEISKEPCSSFSGKFGSSSSGRGNDRLRNTEGKRHAQLSINSVVPANSRESVSHTNHIELEHANFPYYIPSSPSTPTTPNFMSSSSINELASLSRSELTAMGLLPPEPPASMKVKRQRPKRFRCPHCQVAFSNNGQLRGHIRIHTGERPFECEHEGCGKSFTRNEELTRHRRIHTGLRPYPCTHCGKKFGRKDHLKKHTRTHQRPVYAASSGMIGLGNPFHPFNPSLIPSHSAITDFGSVTSPYALPFMLSMPPPISHFPFS